METLYDRDHIAARETLLDAVEALAPHSDAVILVGAQAIYVHAESEDASFALSPFTYDADIALDPGTIGQQPHDSGGHEPRRLPVGGPTGTVQEGRPVAG